MIVGALRIKNEARWIERCLASIAGFCDEIHVFDDHSTDGTPEICERMGVTLYRSPLTGLDETRDKNWLLEQVEAKCAPDFVLCIDGDEELEAGGANALRDALKNPLPLSWSMKVAYLWNAPDLVRVDGVYGRFERASMWRHRRGLRFPVTGNGGNFHCGNVPRACISHRSMIAHLPVRLLHYGYMVADDRVRKYHWYNEKDPNDKIEDFYRHMVIGDLFPPNSKFCYGGPLEVRAL